ncbi:MAG TPA: SDR family oxidoreductase [Pseudonocardia sp.]|nr:SDR family oxidoreductase [Pseudonocardia sp.]
MRFRRGAPTPGRPPTWRWALVTGASSGIGRAIAGQLAADGVNLVLVARREPALRALADDVAERYGIRAEVLPADLADAASRGAVEQRLAQGSPPIDLLVNCAGGGVAGPFLRGTLEQRQYEVELNCVNVLRLCHAAGAAMSGRGRGTIVNMASGIGYLPCPGVAVYGASKAFVLNFSATLRYELRGSGVGVTAVAPGPTRTDGATLAGVDLGRVPRFLVATPERVAAATLAAARADRALELVNAWNRVMPLGRLLPAGVMQPLLAAVVDRLTGSRVG